MGGVVTQRGFSLIVYAVLAVAILGLLSTIVYRIREGGKDAIRVEWAEANKKAAAEQAAREAAARATAAKSAKDLAAAQQKGAEYAEKWKAARSAASKPLASCPESPPRNAARPDDPTPAPGGLRFSWRFVGLYDGIWTDSAGKPVFGNNPAPSGADPDSPSPIGPGEVIDNHAENARTCSIDRRNLDALIGQIEKLRAGWR